MASEGKIGILERLDSAIALTEEIYQVVQSEEWETLSQLELKRQDLLHRCFVYPVPEELAEQVAGKIEKLLELDQEILKSCNQFQERITGSIGKIRHGKAAVDAYNQTPR